MEDCCLLIHEKTKPSFEMSSKYDEDDDDENKRSVDNDNDDEGGFKGGVKERFKEVNKH